MVIFIHKYIFPDKFSAIGHPFWVGRRSTWSGRRESERLGHQARRVWSAFSESVVTEVAVVARGRTGRQVH